MLFLVVRVIKLLQNTCILFQKGLNNYKVKHKNMLTFSYEFLGHGRMHTFFFSKSVDNLRYHTQHTKGCSTSNLRQIIRNTDSLMLHKTCLLFISRCFYKYNAEKSTCFHLTCCFICCN